MSGAVNRRNQVEGVEKMRRETTVIGVGTVGHEMEIYCIGNSLKSTRVILAKTPGNGGYRV